MGLEENRVNRYKGLTKGDSLNLLKIAILTLLLREMNLHLIIEQPTFKKTAYFE